MLFCFDGAQNFSSSTKLSLLMQLKFKTREVKITNERRSGNCQWVYRILWELPLSSLTPASGWGKPPKPSLSMNEFASKASWRANKPENPDIQNTKLGSLRKEVVLSLFEMPHGGMVNSLK